MIRIEDLTLNILTKTTVIPEFKSKDSDLNEFLMLESKDYQEQLLAVTYLLQNPKNNEVVAYFSLLNDTIKFEEDDKKTRNRINRKIPYIKQRSHYPAVKIGRLAAVSSLLMHTLMQSRSTRAKEDSSSLRRPMPTTIPVCSITT